MNYAAIKKHDIANGPGVRVSLFVSGCTHHCEGCFNPETWDFQYGTPYTAETELEILEALEPDYIRGLSLLGGEPLEPEHQAALLPLLQELGCPEGVDEAYWQEVLGKTRTMAEAYPLYLSTNAPAALPGAVQLSERALQVLRLQDRGLTRSEIARQLQLSERSVKYQCEQAYHKLGTSNKVEALAAARKLNLL